jgi:hypothetical protein
VVTKSTSGSAEAVTKASWRVDDLVAEVANSGSAASSSKSSPSWAP